MNRNIFFLLPAMLAFPTAEAQDFELEGIAYIVLTHAEPYTAGVLTKFTEYTGDVVIPEQVTYEDKTYTVTAIMGGAFGHCKNLTSVTIPKTVTSIGQLAFINCTGITSVFIPQSVSVIERGPFAGCSNIDSIGIDADNSWYCSRNGALYNSDMTCLIQFPGAKDSVDIPVSVKEIGDFAFYGNTLIRSVTIPDSVTSLGAGAFFSCTAMTSASLGKSVTSIGRGAFESCSAMIRIDLGDALVSIGGVAFEDCSSLTSIEIPSSVCEIGEEAFINCTGFTAITCLATVPPLLGDGVFGSVPKTIPLYVPAESVDSYKEADGWKDFTVYALPTLIRKQENTGLSFFPNPFDDRITVKGLKAGTTIRVLSQKGELVGSKTAQHVTEFIDLDYLTAGTYIIEVIENGKAKAFLVIHP